MRRHSPAATVIHHLISALSTVMLILTIAAIAAVNGGDPAWSAGTGDDYPAQWKNASMDTVLDTWHEYNRECTSAVAWWLHERNGFEMPFNDNAVNWGPRAQALGYTVDMTPDAGAVAWWASPQHVAWVESVSGSNVVIEQYNADYTGHYSQVTIAANSVSGYIHFRDLPGIPTSAPPGKGGGFASTWSTGRLDAWTRLPNPVNGSNLGHIWSEAAWQPWETISVPNNELMASNPAAVSWGPGRIDIFARGPNNDLIHAWLDGGTWHGWESLGGCIQNAPSVTSWAVGRLDVLAEGCGSVNGTNLMHLWLPPGGPWQPWEAITQDNNELMTSAPAAVSTATNQIDYFARGPSGDLIHAWLDINGWHAWESLGGCIIGAPAASSWGGNRVDAWARSCNTTGANLVHIYHDANGWHPFEVVPDSVTRITATPAITSWATGRIDVFARGSNGDLLHWWLDGASGWAGPESKGGTVGLDT